MRGAAGAAVGVAGAFLVRPHALLLEFGALGQAAGDLTDLPGEVAHPGPQGAPVGAFDVGLGVEFLQLCRERVHLLVIGTGDGGDGSALRTGEERQGEAGGKHEAVHEFAHYGCACQGDKCGNFNRSGNIGCSHCAGRAGRDLRVPGVEPGRRGQQPEDGESSQPGLDLAGGRLLGLVPGLGEDPSDLGRDLRQCAEPLRPR